VASPTASVTAGRLHIARYAVGVATGFLLIFAVAIYSTGNVSRTSADLVELAAASLGALNCALAACSASGRLRLAWAGFAGACLSWAIGQSVWTWYELVLRTEGPFPGLSDLGFLGFPIGAVIGLTVFPSNLSRADRRRMTLDGLTTAFAIGLVSWATALGAVFHAGGSSLFATTVSVAYPLFDIVLLVVCVLVLSRSRAHRAPLACLAVGLVLMSVGDSGFAYFIATDSYVTGNPIDLGWIFAFGVIALSTLAPGATQTTSQVNSLTVAGAVLPYIPLGGAIAFVSWKYATGRAISAVGRLRP